MGGYTSFLRPYYGNWFLVGLVVWHGLAPFLAKCRPIPALLLAVLSAILIGMDPNANAILQISRVVCFLPFYMLGLYLPRERLGILKKPRVRIFGALVSVAAALFCAKVWRIYVPHEILLANTTYQGMEVSNSVGAIMRLAWYFLAAISGFGMMCLVPRRHTIWTVYGTRTLSIFILHTCLFVVLSRKTSFFEMVASIPNTAVLLGVVLLYTFVLTIFFGNAYFAKVFDWLMHYDFPGLLKKEPAQRK